MLYDELPEDQIVIGYASNVDALKILFDKAVGESSLPFVHIDAVGDAPVSCRVLSQQEIPGLTKTSPLPRPYRNRAAAKSFFIVAMMTKSRYIPPIPPSPEARKGWRVSVATTESGQKIVIVKAAWCV